LFYDSVLNIAVSRVEAATGKRATSRIKNTGTILEKLHRQGGGSLPNIQDLAGMRVVENCNLLQQDELVGEIVEVFSDGHKPPKVIDRRAQPSHGYRAVHIVVFVDKLPVEVQVRTYWQHEWANMFEKLADLVGRGIRYDEGPKDWSNGVEAALLKALETAGQAGNPTADAAVDWFRRKNLAISTIIDVSSDIAETIASIEVDQTLVDHPQLIGEAPTSEQLDDARSVLRARHEELEMLFGKYREAIDGLSDSRTRAETYYNVYITTRANVIRETVKR
jgi:ppGpp synthetase/RelA/SpoT-type nucleotidyltranferase